MNCNWLVLVVTMGLAVSGCSAENSASDSGAIDAGNFDAALVDASVIDAAGSAPDADGFCEFVPTPIAPFPEPTVVAPGTSCVSDEDCTSVEGFCRPLSAGGSECATFQGNSESCGGLTAPSEQQRCLPTLSCNAPDAQTMGTCVCIPDCEGKVCGSDGCGSTCGDCDEVCAAEGTVCNDFEGDQCCRPAVVSHLPYERRGHTAGAEDTFDVFNVFQQNQSVPDEVIRFIPPVSGGYFLWSTCHAATLYASCGDSSSLIENLYCIDDVPVAFRILFDAGVEYFLGEEFDFGIQEYIRRIHGPITEIAELATTYVPDIVADDTHVYWSNDRKIFRHAIDGSGLTSVVLSSSSFLRDIELFGDSVYALDSTNGLILKALKTGGAPTVLASGQNRARALTVNGGYVYWSIPATGNIIECDNDVSGMVRRVSMEGGTLEDFALNQQFITDIDSDENHVYWTVSNTPIGVYNCEEGSVQRLAHTGGSVETFGDDSLSYGRVRVGENDIYVAYQRDLGPDGLGDVYTWYRYSKNTLALAHTFELLHASHDAVIDSSGFYVTASERSVQGFTPGGIMKISETGPSIGLIPTLQDNNTKIAISSGQLFLNYENQIISVPLP